ncbi:MAG: response regulator [Alphaproteobacteria bacterium]|nr:response regulator [Alphaproteobacteria bacterium]
MTPASSLPPALVEKYLTQVASRRDALAEFVAHCAQGTPTAGELGAIRIHAHSLKGSGRTYGYPVISAAGSALEEAIDNAAGSSTLAPLARNLLQACEDVLGTRAAAPQSSAPTESDAIPAERPRRPIVAVVDDDPAIMGLLEELLKSDADIFTASNAKDALTVIDQKHPDLIILDDKMPGMTGMQLLEHLESSGTQLPAQIIMLTASNTIPDIIRGMSAGAVDYITKPFDPDKLARRVRNLLRCLQMTVLVADDDDAVRGLLKHKFRMLGFRMIQAEDGEQALKLARETRPQLAIVDRMMPGIDGLTVLQTMRNEDGLRDIPIILLTAKRQNRDVVEGFDLGATDYIVKPFMPDEVVARAMRLLGIQETGRP